MSSTDARSILVSLLLGIATLTALSPALGGQAAGAAATAQIASTAQISSTAQIGATARTTAARPSARGRRKCLPRNHPSSRPARLHRHRHCTRPKPRPAPVPVPAPAPAPAPAPTPSPSDGWTFVTGDEFDGAGLDSSRWTPFAGVPGCCADALWDPSQVEVSHGTLKLHTSRKDGRWLSGGVGGWSWNGGARTYGRYDARIRFDAGKGVSAAALLWPSNNVWPPEIDFYEISEDWGERAQMMMTTHWSTPTNAHRVSQRWNTGDFTQWHTVSLRWTADRIVYLLDGQVVKVDTDPATIPDTRMWVGLQTHAHRIDGAWPTLPAGRSSIAMEVDWVRIYQAG